MTPSLNTENGVSNCGGRAVIWIIGRFCGYLTIGRSPAPNGRETNSAALARDAGRAMLASAACTSARRSIMVSSADAALKLFVGLQTWQTSRTLHRATRTRPMPHAATNAIEVSDALDGLEMDEIYGCSALPARTEALS